MAALFRGRFGGRITLVECSRRGQPSFTRRALAVMAGFASAGASLVGLRDGGLEALTDRFSPVARCESSAQEVGNSRPDGQRRGGHGVTSGSSANAEPRFGKSRQKKSPHYQGYSRSGRRESNSGPLVPQADSCTAWIDGLRSTMRKGTRGNPLGTAPAWWSLAHNWRAAQVS